jgi:secreted Zn-dependent insulinase-like peptidase
LYIPKPNEFIPKNFDVVKVEVNEVCLLGYMLCHPH